MLTSLPTDVLRHLCRILAKEYMRHYPSGSHNILADDAHKAHLESLTQASRGIVAYQAFRMCNKTLRRASDDVRTSIFFRAEEQAEVELYLRKLPDLNAISVFYRPNAFDVRASLISLHSIVPGLVSLVLNPKSGSEQFIRAQADLADALLLWRTTLQHLEMSYIHCTSRTHSGSGSSKGGGSSGGSSSGTGCSRESLSFLSELSALQSLDLYTCSPGMRGEDIAGCTVLVKLSLSGCTGDFHSIRLLDLSPCTSLEEVDCSGFYSADRLVVSKLKVLRVLSCGGNAMKALDVTACTALERLSCRDNRLEVLDVTRNHRLRELHCNENSLRKLNLSGCPLLSRLFCGKSEISELDLSWNRCLTHVSCSKSRIQTLDVTPAAGTLTWLFCRRCPMLQSLTVTGCSKLATLSVDRCINLQNLIGDGCASLISLDCEGSACYVTIKELRDSSSGTEHV